MTSAPGPSSPAGLPHHDGSPLYVSDATPSLGSTVAVRLRVPPGFPQLRVVRVRSNPDREPAYADARVVHATPDAVWWQAEIVVENPVHGYRWLLEDHEANTWWLTSKGLSQIETRDIDDFRLVTHAPPPGWGASMVMYQVFPDRFARSAAADDREPPAWALPASWDDPVIHQGPGTGTQFYGGDLAGVAEHLDHLVDLGVNLLYLTPVFPARSNHRYDALSFDHVDPLLGGDEALVALVEAAHARGLKVIGDLTTNHSGDAHEWFQASYRTPGAPESAFYLWLDEGQTEYVSWLGHSSLPKLNWNSDELRARFIEGPDSVVARYLQPPFAFDGWRIDVANMTGRYRDAGPQRGRAPRDPPHHGGGERRHPAGGGVHQRRVGRRLHGRRLARRHDLRQLHPAAVELAVGAGFAGRRRARHDPRAHHRLFGARLLCGAPRVRGRVPVAHPAAHHERPRHPRHPALPHLGARRACCRPRSGSR